MLLAFELIRIRRIAIPHIWPSSGLSSLKLHSTLPITVQTDLKTPPTTTIEPLTQPQLKALVLKHYKHGKFFDLLPCVVASPNVLLTACHNLFPPPTFDPFRKLHPLLDSVSKRFSIEEMGRELCENGFDVGASCVTLLAAGKKGEPLVLPNLKLKVLIEAIRMLLEVVYDERFVTFSYGGRVGMGRHTAIRYLKNSVQSPNWWFTVRFNRQKFETWHVNKLCSFIKQKIEDGILIDIIRKLFQCQVLQIELGGCYLGRGFPQECGLCPIMINIYFDGFDKEVQEMRLKRNQENLKFDSKEFVSTSDVFYRPVRIYAVRYLDEMLFMTSGSKMITMELKNWVVKHLEASLDLKVDRLNTAIHSAVSEKVDFLGMELQAVSPLVLHPPMSEKAIRARKKYLRQKEVRALELRNARERNRKKLGLKIFSHVFKKLKQSGGFKFEFQIEREVREIFRSWADEVVHEFLQSLEYREEWHRKLSAGSFLSLRHIRDQLPQGLVDAYDKFQEQVDKHLSPVKARKAMQEVEKRAEEEEQQKYAKSTVEDLTKLCMKVDAPVELVRKAVKMVGFTNHMGRPRPIELLLALEDTDIIKWYAGVGRRWLDFFCCCHNFKMVKTVVTYHLRFSCILTLAEKHESTKREAIRHYTKDLKVFDIDGNEEVHFPSEREIQMMGDKNLCDPKPVDGALSLLLLRLASDEAPCYCAAHFCDKTTTAFYRVRLLQNRLNVNPLHKDKWVPGMGAIHESLNKKCLPLCTGHINDLYMGNITLQDVDSASFTDME